MLLAGLNVVVAGYGWCGRGVAMRARGLGANVIVTEVDPTKALEALMDGYRVMSMHEAAVIGDVFITVTGNKHIIGRDHFEKLKNGAILCNSGPLQRRDRSGSPGQDGVVAAARRANSSKSLRCATAGASTCWAKAASSTWPPPKAIPASVMDMSFANQALSADYMVKNHATLEKRVYSVPEALDKQVAKMKLEAMGVKIDRLTVEQEHYLASWCEGT